MLGKRLIKSQKGLSAIVSTLIIILLVLVAAGIIWVVVRGIIQEGTEEIGLGKFTLDLEIKTVQIEDGNVTVILLRRNPGEGNFVGMNFIFSDGTNSEVIREDTVLDELEEKSFTFILTKISTKDLETISVAPIFKSDSGKESIGNIADSFEVTEEMKTKIGGINNFEMLGFKGTGKKEYDSFSSSTSKLPEFKRAIVDPLDVSPGHNQTFTVHVYSPYNITDVTSVTELDNSTLYLDFQKISEYLEIDEIVEVWSANWIVNDTHSIEYITNITAIDSEGNSNFIILTWTDSCQSQITHGQDSTISVSCNTGTSVIAGLDGGSLTIASGVTLTIDSGATWGFNSGESITPTGTIIVTGQISKGNLYYTDGDGDTYASGTTLLFGSGDVRAMSASGTGDCNDGNQYIYQNVASLIQDSDHDYYSVGTAQTRCVGAKSSYWYRGAAGTYIWISNGDTSGTDCYDYNSDAKPGQTSYFTSDRGDGSYDYNCDSGTETKQWNTVGQCYVCYWSEVCTQGSAGVIGWQGSVANCGVSANYIEYAGTACIGRPFATCSSTCYEADINSRTQACR